MVLDVKSVDRLLGTPVPYAYAIKAGPWIFLTGHEAYDWETGTSDEVTGPPGFPLHGRHRSRREGDFILRRMRRVLGEFGSDLSHAVRLDQYYPVPRAVASYHLARHAEFGDYIPPSTSVVMERCFAADATISTSLIAVVPGAGVRDPQNPSIRGCLGANLRLCAGGRLPRLCLRCGPDGAQSRAGARPAWACPGSFRLGPASRSASRPNF